MSSHDFIREELAQLESQGRLRSLRIVTGPQGRQVQVDGRVLLNFCSNNYLGLADRPELIEAAHAELDRAGVGSGASRLIVGTQQAHVELEQRLAAFHQTDAALLFNSGYQANVGTIQALVGRSDVVFSDQLNHASLIDGCRLSRARVEVYPHADVAALDAMLARSTERRKLVVSDAVFSMDGDAAPVAALAEVASRHGALLMVDEAHVVGVRGPAGRGLCAEQGVVPDVLMGTLGKAYGGFGAYVVGAGDLVRLLLNRARSFVFTTAMPASVAAASIAALDLIAGPVGSGLRSALSENISRVRSGLNRMGLLEASAGQSPIFPIVVGSEERTMQACQGLMDRGVFAQGIRPPTVAPGTSRLRVALMATHTASDIDDFLHGLEALRRAGLLSSSAG